MKFSRVLLGMSLVLMFCAAGWAQTGSITGTVKDPRARRLPAQASMITNPDRGINREMSDELVWRLQRVRVAARQL